MRISLRTRLTVWVMTIFLVLHGATSLGFWYYQRLAAFDLFEQRFRERAENVATEVAGVLGTVSLGEIEAIAARHLRNSEFETVAIDVIDAEGRPVVRPALRWPETVQDLAREPLPPGAVRRGPLLDDDPSLRIPPGQHAEAIAVSLPLTSGKLAPHRGPMLLIITTDAAVQAELGLVTRILLAGGLVGLLASAISGWFIAGVAVAPIRKLSGLAERLGPETMDESLVVESDNREVEELSAQLDLARARIREAFAAQERFLSNMSHEIKTPIATLLTEAQTIDRGRLTPDARAFVETAEEEMRKLGHLIESFLTLTRVRDGSGITKLRLYPANEMVMDAVEDCMKMAGQYAVRLTPTLAEGELALEARLIGDPALLRTMLSNLVRNAIRFSPREGRVEVMASIDEGTYTVVVRDEGPGLPADMLDRVFDRFVQSNEEVRRQRGHGLGLAIAKGIAELHHGDIQVRNLPDAGAEFAVTLPLVDVGTFPASTGSGAVSAGTPA